MRENSEASFSTFVQPKAYEDITRALANKTSPLFLTGPAGIGKTTLLLMLKREWEKKGKLVFYCSLSQISGETDIFLQLRNHFSEDLSPTINESPLVIASSSGHVLNSAVRVLNSLPAKSLILLNGFDETRNQRAVMSFVHRASQSKALLVASGRHVDTGMQELFSEVYAATPLIAAEIDSLIERVSPQTLSSTQKQKIREIAGIRSLSNY